MARKKKLFIAGYTEGPLDGLPHKGGPELFPGDGFVQAVQQPQVSNLDMMETHFRESETPTECQASPVTEPEVFPLNASMSLAASGDDFCVDGIRSGGSALLCCGPFLCHDVEVVRIQLVLELGPNRPYRTRIEESKGGFQGQFILLAR